MVSGFPGLGFRVQGLGYPLRFPELKILCFRPKAIVSVLGLLEFHGFVFLVLGL